MSDNSVKEVSPRHSPSNQEDSKNPSNLADSGASTHRCVSAEFEGGSGAELAPKRGPWRRVGGYIGRDVTGPDGRRTTELQHRWVLEQALGRKLDSSIEVHHRNEVKDDNRPENLEALSKAEHTRRHSPAGRTMVTLTCHGCGSSFERDVRRRNSRFCGRSCSSRFAGRRSGEARLSSVPSKAVTR